MKKTILLIAGFFLVLALIFLLVSNVFSSYPYPEEDNFSATDSLIARTFEIRTLEMGSDYEGKVVATLLSHLADSQSDRAVLYIHGFGDYFFQLHLAAWYNRQGFNFYALELRKYGHSWLPHQRPNFMRSLTEYFPEIDRAIEIITEADNNSVLLVNGHSTGGLTSSLYAAEGEHRDRIDGLFLNSPFLDFSGGEAFEQVIHSLGTLGAVSPGGAVPRGGESDYTKSLHRNYYGRWDFNTNWKPIQSFPVYLSWLRGILQAHRQVDAGLTIDCPVLVFHSDRSYSGNGYSEEMHHADAVLDVEDIHRQAPKLGPDVTCLAIPGATHDIFLSPDTAIQRAFQELAGWLEWKGLDD